MTHMARSKATSIPEGKPRAETPLYNALGCAIRIDDNGLPEEQRAEVQRIWSGARAELGDPLPVAHLTVPVPEGSFESAILSLSQKVTLAAIEARRGQLWMLHAAGIADDEGRVIALVAPSGTGKTTAARELATTYGYVSDETVGIAPDGTVVPYRKPLSMIETSTWVKAQRSPEELGLRPLPKEPLRLAAIVLLDRREDGPNEPVIEPCDLGDALEELVAQTSYICELPAPLRTIAALSAAAGGIRRVVYREASMLATALAPLFVDAEPISIQGPMLRSRTVPEAPGWYRASYLDAISFDDPDRIALLQPGSNESTRYRLVASIGSALWRAAEGISLDDLEAAAESAYGAPEGGSLNTLVEATIEELLDQQILEAEPSWRVREDVAVTGNTGRFVVLSLADLSGAVPLAMEGSAATIWEKIARSRGTTATRLVEMVADEVGLTPADISADVLAFLDSLREQKLFERYLP